MYLNFIYGLSADNYQLFIANFSLYMNAIFFRSIINYCLECNILVYIAFVFHMANNFAHILYSLVL